MSTRLITAIGTGLLATGGVIAGTASASQSSSSRTPKVRVVDRFRSSYGNFTRLEVDCPSGSRLSGGGAEALGSNAILNGSFPNDSGTGWIADGHQPGVPSVGLHVFAVCTSARGKVRVVHRLRSSYPNFKRLHVECPSGFRLSGGGAEALGSSSILNTTIPNRSHTGWVAVGHQPGVNSVGLHVFAVCTTAPGGVQVVRKLRSSYPNFTRLGTSCPAADQLDSGGAEALGPNSILNATVPSGAHGATWFAVGRQPGSSSVGLHTFVICVKTTG